MGFWLFLGMVFLGTIYLCLNKVDLEEFSRNYEHTIQALTAFFTLLAVIVSLWLARPTKSKIKASLQLTQSSTKKSYKSSGGWEYDQAELKFINEGLRPAYIQEKWILMTLPWIYRSKEYILIGKQASSDSAESSFCLNRDDPPKSLIFDSSLLFPSISKSKTDKWDCFQRFLFRIINFLGYIRIFGYTAEGQTFKVKLSKKDKRYLLKHIQNEMESP